MRPTQKIESLIKKLKLKAGPELDHRVHNQITKAIAESKKIKPGMMNSKQ